MNTEEIRSLEIKKNFFKKTKEVVDKAKRLCYYETVAAKNSNKTQSQLASETCSLCAIAQWSFAQVAFYESKLSKMHLHKIPLCNDFEEVVLNLDK